MSLKEIVGKGRGNRSLRSSWFSEGEMPSQGDSSHQTRAANTKRHFCPLKLLLLSKNNESVHGGHDFPLRPSLGNPSSAKPTEEIQNKHSPEDGM